jgi:hypothetical protein
MKITTGTDQALFYIKKMVDAKHSSGTSSFKLKSLCIKCFKFFIDNLDIGDKLSAQLTCFPHAKPSQRI